MTKVGQKIELFLVAFIAADSLATNELKMLQAHCALRFYVSVFYKTYNPFCMTVDIPARWQIEEISIKTMSTIGSEAQFGKGFWLQKDTCER